MNIVIVESAAKAKTINKYLGKDFKVIASFGHVRDLPAKDGSVRPDEDFAMAWEVADDFNIDAGGIYRRFEFDTVGYQRDSTYCAAFTCAP